MLSMNTWTISRNGSMLSKNSCKSTQMKKIYISTTMRSINHPDLVQPMMIRHLLFNPCRVDVPTPTTYMAPLVTQTETISKAHPMFLNSRVRSFRSVSRIMQCTSTTTQDTSITPTNEISYAHLIFLRAIHIAPQTCAKPLEVALPEFLTISTYPNTQVRHPQKLRTTKG